MMQNNCPHGMYCQYYTIAALPKRISFRATCNCFNCIHFSSFVHLQGG